MALFVGEFEQTLDAKHRLAISSVLREQIVLAEPGELVAFAKAFSAAVVDFPACRWQSHSWRLDCERIAAACQLPARDRRR